MKVEPECLSCLLYRGYLQIRDSTKNLDKQFRALSTLTNFLAKEFKPTAVAATLGTKRDRMIKEITGNPDPYSKAKQQRNQMALKILPTINSTVLAEASPYSRFRKACLVSIVGNSLEIDIPGHGLKHTADIIEMIQQAERDLVIDEIKKIFKIARKSKNILYLTDNSGEIAFDTLLVRELKNLGSLVIVAVKGEPVLDDATLEDAKFVGMDEVADEVISTGSGTVGLNPDQCSKDFMDIYQSSDMVVAKGMGHAETLTEFKTKTPQALLLRTKCAPVANYFKVGLNKNIAYLMD